jgi:hypothetical protein
VRDLLGHRRGRSCGANGDREVAKSAKTAAKNFLFWIEPRMRHGWTRTTSADARAGPSASGGIDDQREEPAAFEVGEG